MDKIIMFKQNFGILSMGIKDGFAP